MPTKKKVEAKQHAKITQQVRDLYKVLNDCVSHSGSLQRIADALRDARLDELKHTPGVYANDYVVKRIVALERGEA